MKSIFAVIFAIAALISPLIAHSQTTQPTPRPVDECRQHTPFGLPTNFSQQQLTLICRTGFILAHDNNARIAAWVSYVIIPSNLLSCNERNDAFAADRSLRRGFRAEVGDYYNSGYDMGHIANNADLSWNLVAARESFILSNIAPQLPNLNRGLWRQLESATRSWAFTRNTPVLIYSGPVYDNATSTRIGRNGVVVPSAFYKILVDLNTGETLAFLFPHRERLTGLTNVQTTVSNIENVTQIEFHVPDDKNVRRPMWPINHAPLTTARRVACRN